MGSIGLSEHQSNPIRLAILECDTPCPQAQARYGSYGGMFEALFLNNPKAGPTDLVLFTKYWVDRDDAEYPDLEDVDVILITGSKHSAYKDVPWINRLVQYTAAALRTPHVKVIGVCFGHQIIGRALNVPVKLNNMGWEMAVLPIALTPMGESLFSKDKLNLQFSHQDIVVSCPKGVENLGSTPLCAVQGMYQHGNFISLQGHPEFNEEVLREILSKKQADGVISQAMYEDGIQKAALEHDGLLVGRLFWRFILEDSL